MEGNINPLPDRPALMADDSLIIADLHIGKEVELQDAGFTLPSQAKKMGEEVLALVEEAQPARLVILGDLKHLFPKSTGLERREVPRFFDRLEGRVKEAHLVLGNHDGGIFNFLPRWVTLHEAKGFRLGEVGLAHGHAWPSHDVMKATTLILGHNHPSILFRDRLGFRNIQRCWIRTSFSGTLDRYPHMPEELVIVPAFNEFSGGTTMNETGSRYLGPLVNSRALDMMRAEVYLLDGIHLGRLKDMMVKGKGESLE